MKPISELQQHPGWTDWHWQMKHLIRSLDDLAACLQITADLPADLTPVAKRYPVAATPHYVSLAQAADLQDPIVAQILPRREELTDETDARDDPLAEERDSPVPGLIHRYPDRALVVTTSACAVHCRHCMRKRSWDCTRPSREKPNRDRILAYMRSHKEIKEIILSGGDPMLLPDASIETLIAALHAIPHIDLVRIGSRLPVVLPQRFTPAFCARLARYGPVWMATHANHAQELSPASEKAVLNLLRAGIPVLNQTVLLKGINDSAATQRDLCRALVKHRIKPYYLFHGDPVAGTTHFRTGLNRALDIVDELRTTMSGLAQPTFAFDLPDGGGKIRLEPAREIVRPPEGDRRFRDFRGFERHYPEPPQQA